MFIDPKNLRPRVAFSPLSMLKYYTNSISKKSAINNQTEALNNETSRRYHIDENVVYIELYKNVLLSVKC